MTRKNKNDFEASMQRLQVIVEELEGGKLPLEKSLALYREGRSLSAFCKEQLASARLALSVQEGDALRGLQDNALSADLNEAGEPLDG